MGEKKKALLLQGSFASALGGRFSHLIRLSAFFLRSQMFFTKKHKKA
jgi:hypothetical protein